jgi:4-hydroxybenzoate polyprenyltransferase
MQWNVFTKLVKIEESLFGLPWVLTAALLPFCSPSFAATFPWQQWERWVCILGGFVTARTAGMSFNRLIDHAIDAANPRTANRPLPTGEATRAQVASVAWVNVIAFVVFCAFINPICLGLSPLVIALLWLYSYAKRYTSLCHFVLGIIQFFGPFFAWAAITDSWGIAPILLGSAILASISGVDIIYALQDYQFDKRHGLYSLPVALGPERSLWVARLLHALTAVLLLQAAYVLHLGSLFYAGIAGVVAIYLQFHRKIDPENLATINPAFFRCNTMVGLTLLMSTVGTLVWRALF